jgi:hypothetical protein
MKANGIIRESACGGRYVVINDRDCSCYGIADSDHPCWGGGKQVVVSFDEGGDYATIISEYPEIRESPKIISKITKITVHYQDGSSQVADFGPQDVECEAFYENGGLHNAGNMAYGEFLASLSDEIRQSMPKG